MPALMAASNYALASLARGFASAPFDKAKSKLLLELSKATFAASIGFYAKLAAV